MIHSTLPWYIAGPLIGLTVPALLLIGNKAFGLSSSLRHICASCVPCGIPFFCYDWKKESWSLFFVLGIFIGGIICYFFIPNPAEMIIHPDLKSQLSSLGITNFSGLIPTDLFSWQSLQSVRGFVLVVVGGFLVGFGTRYAGGCTSGHAIMGLSNLQWPSLVATICFMLGGFFATWVLLPFILKF